MYMKHFIHLYKKIISSNIVYGRAWANEGKFQEFPRFYQVIQIKRELGKVQRASPRIECIGVGCRLGAGKPSGVFELFGETSYDYVCNVHM